VVIGDASEEVFYYHPDHLGSTAYLTDQGGHLSEHLEYFPFGETWVQEGGSKKTPYMYTSKEYDSETGLYYYGARYYDPRTSVWQSADPILEKYLPNLSDRIAAERNGQKYDPEKSLKGMGGVYNTVNMNLNAYAGNNPVLYVDPNGSDIYVSWVASNDFGGHMKIAVDNPNNPGKLSVFGFASKRYMENPEHPILAGGQAGTSVINYKPSESPDKFKQGSKVTVFKTSSAQDKKALDVLNKTMTNKSVNIDGSNYRIGKDNYAPFTNNCGDYVEDALSDITGGTYKGSYSIFPSSSYNDIENNSAKIQAYFDAQNSDN